MGSLVGRYFAIGHADGYAYYQVIKELKTRVHVQHIMGIGDDYADHYFGYGGSFPKNEVLRYVDRQGKMAELFG